MNANDDNDIEQDGQIKILADELEIAGKCMAKHAVDLLDAKWYNRTTQLGRWMDVIGDFAGEELILLEGDSLLGVVLDDPLLALGREDDNSFQFLHARYSLERVLQAYSTRNAVFEVVFFEDHRHITYRTGAASFMSASRRLARTFLMRSLSELQIHMHIFQNLEDARWSQFFVSRKPMLVLTSDGGRVGDETALGAARALIMRAFIFDLLAGGIAVALMDGAHFKDSKIISLIYDQRRSPTARQSLHEIKIWNALTRAHAALDAKSPVMTAEATAASDRAGWLHRSARAFLGCVNSSDNLAHPLLYVFLVHALVLDNISITLRAQPLPNLPSELEKYLRNSFLPLLFHSLEQCMPTFPGFRDIDLDGRMFLRLVQIFLCRAYEESDAMDLLGPEVVANVASVWGTLGVEAGLETLSFRFHDGFKPSMHSPPVHDPEALSVLPFSHPVFDQHLAPVQVTVNASPSTHVAAPGYFDFGSGIGAQFEDKMHWHNSRRAILPRHLGGRDEKPLPAASDMKARARALRGEQKFHASLQRQAQSLTGALGKPLEKIVVPPVGAKAQTQPLKASKKASHDRGSSKKAIKEKKTSVERTRNLILEQKQKEKDSEDSIWWKDTLDELERLSSREVQRQKTELYLRNSRTASGWLAVEVRLYRLHLEVLDWIDHPNREDAETCDRFRVNILNMVKNQMPSTSPTAAAILASVLTALGLTEIAASLPESTQPSASGRKLSFKFVKVVKASGTPVYRFMRLEEPPTHWMLRCFGEYMDRSLDSRPDKRVPFEPDGWQRRVLDSLDEDASVLVVAPTSAGKTFISFYAMERVLRSSDDGTLVYVAPTKALIAAEVAARYSKDVDGRNCWAIHTRDYRIHDPQKCQILITVPEVLSIMLLSPPLARVWTPRLKRIILDEIHSIGQEEGGSVWEQILLLAPCPIIGLSATVGQPENFNRWLCSVQSAHHFQHTFIEHPYRYSHLRKFYYMPPKGLRKFMGLSKYARTDRLRFLHPVSLLASGMARALPPDFALEARDCLSLFNALKQQGQLSIRPSELEALDPANFFAHERNRLLKQEDVLRYETELKKILDGLIREPYSHEQSSTLQAVVRSLCDPVIEKEPETGLSIVPHRMVMEEDFINVVSDLHVQGDLPALIFSFDRQQCETLAKRLYTTLEEAEEKWRETSVEWGSKMRAWEQWQAKAKARERLKEPSQRRRPDEDHQVEQPSSMPDDMSSFDPSEPLPDFSFAGIKTSIDKASLSEELDDLEWTSTPRWALKAIKRGIAVHHSGMNRKYRNVVEMLFRIGLLRVVIATGTLALGINAPCRTVVFFGDSAFLTALQFRQAAGRAGRRGFDLLGKVVFYGLPLERAQRLVLSKLPPVSGQFPLSTTLCLRLFNLLVGSQDSDYAKKAISSILSLPQISTGSNMGKEGLLHHVRFSIEYLLRARLLSTGGEPLNLTSVATHLYYHQPYNLAFVALLRSGVIHKICNQESRIDATNQLMLVLAYLFGRRRIPSSALNEDTLRPLMRYPSMIVLPPLPQEVREVLIAHGELTLRTFASYACSYATQYAEQLGPDDTLPLSKVRIVPREHTESKLARILHSTSLKVAARSAFVAASGYSDIFTNVGELCHNARQGLHLNESAIPSVDTILDTQFRLNAYLLDFYLHGQVVTLERANGIRRGDVWFLLQDFDLVLKTIKTSLEELLLNASKGTTAIDSDDDPGRAGLGFNDAYDDEEESVDDEFPRPLGVRDADWKVYQVVSGLSRDFNTKFREMWA